MSKLETPINEEASTEELSEPQEQTQTQQQEESTQQESRALQRDHSVPQFARMTNDWYGRGGPTWFDQGVRMSYPHQREFGRLLFGLFAISILIAVVCSSALSHFGSSTENKSHPFTMGKQPKLVISNDTGSIHIIGKLNGPYGVQELRKASGMGAGTNNFSVYYNQLGNTFEVSGRVQKDIFFVGSKSIDFEVSVPVMTEVTAYTETGTITIENVKANISAETSTGSITVKDVSGKMNLKTQAGSVQTQNVKGQLVSNVETGDITLNQTSLSGQSAIKAISGKVTFTGSLDKKGTYRFETLNGPVDITLPATTPFRLNVNAEMSTVKNEFGRFEMGKGQLASITVSTLNDAIYIRKAPPTK